MSSDVVICCSDSIRSSVVVKTRTLNAHSGNKLRYLCDSLNLMYFSNFFRRTIARSVSRSTSMKLAVVELNPAIGKIPEVNCLLPQLVFAINDSLDLRFQEEFQKHVIDRQFMIHLMFSSLLNLNSVRLVLVHEIANYVPA